MPTYITLLTYTPQGIEKIKESPARLEKAKAAIKTAGGEMKAFYLTMGAYDAVAISEAPSNEAYTRPSWPLRRPALFAHKRCVRFQRPSTGRLCLADLGKSLPLVTQSAPPLSSGLGPSSLATCGSQSRRGLRGWYHSCLPGRACP